MREDVSADERSSKATMGKDCLTARLKEGVSSQQNGEAEIETCVRKSGVLLNAYTVASALSREICLHLLFVLTSYP
jgi:hypothetical protein